MINGVATAMASLARGQDALQIQKAAQPRLCFARRTDVQPEQIRAEALYEAGATLARKGQGAASALMMNQAFEACRNPDFRFNIAAAVARGVNPGLPRNSSRADEMLQAVLPHASAQLKLAVADLYAKELMDASDGRDKAAALYMMLGQNGDWRQRVLMAHRLGSIERADQAKQLIREAFEQEMRRAFGHDRKRVPASPSWYAGQLRYVKLMAGVSVEASPILLTGEASPFTIPGLQDADEAARMLARLGELLCRPNQPVSIGKIRNEILALLAFGVEDKLPPNKPLAKALIDAG